MATIRVSGLRQAQGGIEGARRRLSNLSPLTRDLAVMLQRQTQARFITQKAPDGQSWIPSRRAEREGGQTLTDTGRLRGSFLFSSTPNSASVFTNLSYAVYHQSGTPRMPERPMLGMGRLDLQEMNDIAQRYISGSVR